MNANYLPIILLCYINIASLSKHIDKLRSLLRVLKHPFNIIGITETRMCDDDPLVNIDIEGYEFKHTPTKTKCGGAGIYVKSCYNYEIIKDISNSLTNLTETLFIEIKRKGQKNVIIGCIYRHHSPVSSFLDKYLINTLDKLSKQPNKICALMGDFNIDLAKYSSHAETSEFYDLLSSHGYRPLILQPTRVTSTSATLIDNIFINDMSCHSTGGNITSSVPDHYFQFSQLDIFESLKNKYTIKYARDYRNFNKPEFSEELSNIDWNYITTNNNIDTNRSYNLFYYKIEKILDEIAPYRKMTKNELRLEQRPWITRGILQSMRKRDNLYKSMAREKDFVLKLEISKSYKHYRNMIVTLLKQSKKNYYSSYFIENQNNVKKLGTVFEIL